ncbi:hypothetical protein L596_012414 [Steinernema carpocapsae]|uniref:BPTI/Kunitz inhibitor domain-containing protein n=1 Tax=Steinernema carpocapsae TaxID=34508 RepID=A0A4V6A4S2_STECR|nr:hypothetical protein L596_012414 [Steinernema carpocapsae]
MILGLSLVIFFLGSFGHSLLPPFKGHQYVGRCDQAFDAGNETEPEQFEQRFYWDKDWRTCMGFKYSGSGGTENNFVSIHDCHRHCRHPGGSVCAGPFLQIDNLLCYKIPCPKGFSCYSEPHGITRCCKDEYNKASLEAYVTRCPNKRRVLGYPNHDSRNSYEILLGKTCDELICGEKNTCVQVNKYFAKCCEGTW